MKTSELLIEARRKIAEVGWTQGRMFACDEHGVARAYCATGAIKASSTESEKAIEAVGALLSNHYDYPSLIEWNDWHGRTKDDVLSAFDTAIATQIEKERTCCAT